MDEELKGKCICKLCPSFVDCSEPIAYCLSGVELSKCIKAEVGCVCPGCPVFEKMGFDREYYCIR